MKKISLITFTVLSIFFATIGSTFAQKINDERVDYSYWQAPKVALPENIKTYSVKVVYANERRFNTAYANVAPGILVPTGRVNIPGANMYDFENKDKEWTDKYLTIPSLQKVTNNADLNIELIFGVITIPKKEEDKIRNAEKKVVAWGYKYHYFTSITFKITSKGKVIVSEKNEVKSEATMWQNSMYIIPNTWFLETEMFLSDKFVESDGFVFANRILKETTPQQKTVRLYLYTPKTNKKQDYSDVETINKEIEQQIKIAGQQTPENMQQLQKIANSLDTLLSKADLSDSKAKINEKVIPYLQNSKAITSFLLKNYEKASESWKIASEEREIAKDNKLLPFLIENKIK